MRVAADVEVPTGGARRDFVEVLGAVPCSSRLWKRSPEPAGIGIGSTREVSYSFSSTMKSSVTRTWGRAPSRWLPGTAVMQPFASVASSSAIQHEESAIGSMGQ